jgi:threonine/homoserine/homoserine lactone efflux protein
MIRKISDFLLIVGFICCRVRTYSVIIVRLWPKSLQIEHFGLFIVAGLLLNMMPGPDTFYILARTFAQGRKAGMQSVLGISTGCLVHTVAAALGLFAILVASSTAFMGVKLCGACYLVYLGLRMLFESSKRDLTEPTVKPANGRTIFTQAVVTNVLNPKVAVFFLAFLPQFVSASTHHTVLPFLFLGLVFILNGTIYCMLLVTFASAIFHKFKTSQRTTALFKRATGGVFVGLGVKLAVNR